MATSKQSLKRRQKQARKRNPRSRVQGVKKKGDIYEFWAIDKDGNKYNEYLTTTSKTDAAIDKFIETEFKFKISECLDFGKRKTR